MLVWAIGWPAAVQAQVTPVAHDGKTAQVVQAPNGTPVVNIVAPNAKGVSHNTYDQLDVDSRGLIFNNSAQISNTKLAGYIYGNSQLGSSGSASIILNEVTSTKASQLNGYMEVAGPAAELIIANPNGISCNGCGFINTPRGVLTTGTPVFGGDGSLAAFRVVRGGIHIGGSGLDASGIDRVDLLARTIDLNAKLWAKRLNVVAGANRIAYGDLSTQRIDGEGDAPGVGIDVAALGGMYANVIHLVGTETGVGVNSEGEIAAQNGDFTLTNAGEIVLDGSTTATGTLQITTPQQVQSAGVLAAHVLAVQASALDLSGTVYSDSALSLRADGAIRNHGQIQSAGGSLSLHAGGDVSQDVGASMASGGAIELHAGSVRNVGAIEAGQTLSVTSAGAVANSGVLQADHGALGLTAASLDNRGQLLANGDIALQATDTLSSTGKVVSGGRAQLQAGGALVTDGTVQAAQSLMLQGLSLQSGGALYALGGDLDIDVTGDWSHLSAGDAYASGQVLATTASLSNAGHIEAGAGSALHVGGLFDNQGQIQTDQGALSVQAESIGNAGALSAQGSLALQTDRHLVNDGVIVGAQDVAVDAGTFDNLGQVQSGTQLHVQADTLHNQGVLHAKGDAWLGGTDLINDAQAKMLADGALTLADAGQIENAGTLQAGTDLTLTQAGTLDNASGALLYAGHDLDLHLTQALNNDGTLQAGRTQTIHAGSLTNAGTLTSLGSLSLTTQGDASSQGAIEAQQDAQLQVGGTLDNQGHLYAIDGDLALVVAGALQAGATSDLYAGGSAQVSADAIAQSGQLEARGKVALTVAQALNNDGTIQSDQGDLQLDAAALGNSGTLSAAQAVTLTIANTLQTGGVVVSGAGMQLNAATLQNQGQMQSGASLGLQVDTLDNQGSIKAGDALAVVANDVDNAQGAQLVAAGDLDMRGNGHAHSDGVIQSGGALSVQNAGDVYIGADGVIYAAQQAQVTVGGLLQHAGSIYGALGLVVDAGSLDNAGVLRSAGALRATVAGDASNTGTTYAGGTLDWTVGGLLDNAGVLAAQGDVDAQAARTQGNGTWAAGLASDGSLGANGQLTVTASQSLAAGGSLLAGGDLDFSGSSLDLSGAQARAGGDLTLVATSGDIVTRSARLQANGSADLTASGSWINGGSAVSDGGQMSADVLGLHVSGVDNRHGTLLQSGTGDLDLRFAGAFDNAYGTLATNAANLSVHAASIDNSQGQLQHAGTGLFTLTSDGALVNQAGTIAGNGALQLQANGSVDNRAGTIEAADAVQLQGDNLDNAGGSVVARQLDVSAGHDIDNSAGTLQAQQGATIQSATLENAGGFIKAVGTQSLTVTVDGLLNGGTGGFIGSNGSVTVHAGAWTNAGQVYAGDMLAAVVQGALNNASGALQAQGSVNLQVAGALGNHAGRIESGAAQSGASLSVHAVSLDNSGGRLANAGQGATTIAIQQNVDNRGGTLGGQGVVDLSAGQLDNRQSGRLVSASDLTFKLAGINNSGGTVYAAHDIDWTHAGAGLTNTSGQFGAAGTLALSIGNVSNAGGDLDAGQDLNLHLSALSGDGRVVAGRDLLLDLPGSYVNGQGNALKANRNLTLNVGGTFTNSQNAHLQAVGTLAVHAATIDNAAGAVIDSVDTTLVATQTLNNAGRVEGDSVNLTANYLLNTGTLIGGQITAHAQRLDNGADLGTATGNAAYQSALIAATDSIALYVSGTLLNRDATIFTTGDLTLAADAALGRSAAIINRSGDIEADGDIQVAAQQLTNERRVVNTTTHVLTSTEQASNTTTSSTTFDWTTDPIAVAWCAQYATMSTNGHALRCGPMGYYGDSGHKTLTETVQSVQRLVDASASSRLLAGRDIRIGGSVLNDASTIAAGRNLFINGANGAGGGGSVGGETVQNIAWAPSAQVRSETVYAVDGDYKGSRWYSNRESGQPPIQYRPTEVSTSTVALDPSGNNGWIQIAPGAGLSASMTAGQTVSIQAHTINNTVVNADGQPVHGAIGLGANTGGSTITGGASGSVGSVGGGSVGAGKVSLGQAAGASAGGGDVAVAAGRTGVSGSQASADQAGNGQVLPPQSILALGGSDAHLQLPQSGLYSIDRNPNSSYLIETDPRFADYSQFISSDYLLDHLGLSPADVGKRLGDGFYEQRQVLDQITELTGRRFLSGDTDALAQYRDLMDAGIQQASSFDLTVGVALTAEQMASLTEDMVWLVSEDVDGQQVLVPVVYLSAAHAKAMTQGGAQIAGTNVELNADGEIQNNGSIQASQNAVLHAGNLLNSGSIDAGGDLGITSAQNILNGGSIHAGGNVSLVAGNDIRSGLQAASVLGIANLSGLSMPVSATDLSASLPGAISAGGNLFVSAGRDLSLSSTAVSAGQDLQLSAARDLNVTAAHLSAGHDIGLLAGRDIDLGAMAHQGGDSHGMQMVTHLTHDVAQLQAGHDVTVIAGRDVNSQGAQVTAGGVAAVGAGRDLNLQAVTDTTIQGSGQEHGHHSSTQSRSDDTLRGTSLSGTQGVVLQAGRDANLTATSAYSEQGNVSVSATHDVHLNAGAEQHTTEQYSYSRHNGVLSSSSTTTHDATQDSVAVGTSLSGVNVSVTAGHDLTTQGAQIGADQAVVLGAGHNVELGAATDTHDEQHERTTTKRGGGMGVLTGTSKGDLFTRRSSSQSDSSADRTAYGTAVSGDSVSVVAGNDIDTQGAQVAATHDVVMAAGHDLNIGTATSTHSESHSFKNRTTGAQRSGLHGMFGISKGTQKASETDVTPTGSLIGSSDGSVTLTAGHDVHITGSDVLSQTGTAIVGQNVTIDAAVGSVDTHQSQSQHTGGIMAGLSGGVVGQAESAYASGKAAGHTDNKRLKALYAVQAGYAAHDAYKGGSQSAKQGSATGTGTSLRIGIGASTVNSHADSHDDVAYGSHIQSQGDVTIAATNGDLNVIGSQVHGQNVSLSASHDLNLLSQAEQHTQSQSQANAGGEVGVSIGQTTGIYATVNGGKGRTHGNGTTHLDTQIGADDTLNLFAGNDATIQGAQATGNTVLADIGHDLHIASEQDTNDYASNNWQGSVTVVYGFSGGGAGVSGSASAAQTDSKYKSVTQTSGIAAGDGGYDISVGHHTDLTGGVIASTADPSRNLFSTGSLSYSDLQNEADYSAWSASVGGGYGTGNASGMTGFQPSGSIPQGKSSSSVTHAGIAQGTVDIR
ncbi:hemagglutinin repeat-containing protein, partial [Oleiagrimonas soli]